MASASPGRPLLVLHGASARGSRHRSFVRAAAARGFAPEAPDLPGHGAGRLDGSVLDWVRAQLRPGGAIRGGSLGGWLALHAAADEPRVAAVVALAPTGERFVRLRYPGWRAEVDGPAFERFLDAHDVEEAVTRIAAPVLYVVAADDERIPPGHVEELHARTPRSELVVLPGGGHGGPGHDRAVHALTLDWLERTLAARPGS